MPGSSTPNRIFDQVADHFDSDIPFFATCGQQFVAWLDPPSEATIVDVGAGRGAVCIPATSRGCQVTAVDAAPRMLELLSAEHPQLTTMVMDAQALDLPAGSFDLATAGFLLHLLPHPDLMLKALHGVLRPGGRVALSLFDPNLDCPQWTTCFALLRDYWRYADPTVKPPWRSVDPARLLEEAGFVNLTTTSTTIEVPMPDPDAFWRWSLGNGQRSLIDALPAARAVELRALLRREVSGINPMVYRRGVAFWSARVPG